MLLLEHQGKDLLRRFGIAVPAGSIVRDEASLAAALADGGAKVLKAQVAAGGRGKAGAIRFAATPAEALAAFRDLMAMTVGGQPVEAVLVEDRIAIAHERYAGIQIDGGRLKLLLARRGGVDIEAITAGDPDNFRTVDVDVIDGPDAGQLRRTFAALALPEALQAGYEAIALQLFALARASDAVTAEINPLVETADGRLLALDARIFLDEAALERQPALAAHAPAKAAPADAPVRIAPNFKVNPDGGAIGLIGLGSGLNVTLMDWVAGLGGPRVGLLVDIDSMILGGRAEQAFAAALDHLEAEPAIRSILVCIISCGGRMDDTTRALIAGVQSGPRRAKPVVLYLRGFRMAEAQPLLDRAGLANAASLAAAIAEVAALAGERAL